MSNATIAAKDAWKEVWANVQTLNRAWTVEGTPERLVDFFAPR